MTSSHMCSFSVSEREYSFKSNWFERNGTAMHYVDEGKGTAVVMLHGNPTWSFLYRGVIKELRSSCRCIAPDYPGFGFSEHPPNYGYMPHEHAEWVSALLEHLKLNRYVFVVQDWGGPIGMSVAIDRPEKVAGLVICNTWCWPPLTKLKSFSYLMGGPLGKYLHIRRNFFARIIVPMGISDPSHRTPEILKAYTDPFPTPQSRVGTYVFPRELRKSRPWLGSIESKLSLLRRKPVEMVWAMQDIAFGDERVITRWQKYFPASPVDRIADAKHYLQGDYPDRVAAGVKRLLARL